MFTFRSMNTDVSVIATNGDEAAIASRIAGLFWQAERRFSRFQEDSELSWLNRREGPVTVSEELFGALSRARAYTALTGGAFDPGIGASLAALGYDRSFAPGALDRTATAAPPRAGSLREVSLDAESLTVTRPAHVQIDLGGMIKGATLDAAAAFLDGNGVVDAGGDAVLRGHSHDGDDWLVEVEDPGDASRTVALLAAPRGAVATSAPNRRTWRIGGTWAHHLIDPRTGTAANTDLAQATVTAPSGELADVFAKTAFLLGAEEGRRFLELQPGVGAVLVRRSGKPLFVGDLDLREVCRE